LILDAITLINFGIYKGEHTVVLTPKKNKPIILFGAYNGSGKTTLLEALQLVLFGKNAYTNSRGKLAYDDYLKSLINRDINHQYGSGLSLDFRTKNDGKDEAFKITRTWSIPTNNIKETFEVTRNNQFDPISSERWYEFVEEIMPSQIAELFFFDGEKLEGLADPLRSANLLRSGIYSLLGINSIDNLIRSLSQLEKKKLLQTASNKQTNEVQKIETELEALISEEELLVFEVASFNTQIDQLDNKIIRTQNDLKLSGADLYYERHNLDYELKLATKGKENLNQDLLKLADELSPLLIVEDLVDELKSQSMKSSGHNQRSFKILEDEFAIILNSLKIKSKANNFLTDQVEIEFKKRLSEIETELQNSSIDITIYEIPSKEDFVNLRNNINSKLKELENINSNIEIASKKLQAVPSEENIKIILDKLNNFEKEKIRIELSIENLKKKIHLNESRKTELQKAISTQLAEITESNIAQKVNARVLEHTKRSKATLEKFKYELIKSNIETLSNEITLCFQQLHRKSKFNLKFEINPNTFTLDIIKAKVGLFSANKLSAGERQLLAVSVLWALAKCSGKTLPTIIDTPLGRLDGPHRKKIVNNYFPMASEQVIIFSTDEEVTQPLYQSLKTHIAAEYKINYSEETESSTFELGYF
jgi:DNA sulfur modification protein DndD